MSILNTTIIYDYDEDDDILYLSIGEPTPSISDEIEEGIILRKDMKTKKVTGVTILDYKYRKSKNQKIKLPKGFDLDAVKV